MKKAILLSGGIDSLALAFWKRTEIEVAVTIDYGQLNAKAEINASKNFCDTFKIKHEILKMTFDKLGAGEMKKNGKSLKMASSPEWWPYRNQYLITIGCMKAIEYNVKSLIVGTVSDDSHHKDGSKGFYELINKLVNLQEGGLIVEAPGINITSLDLVKISQIPIEILCLAHSCHKKNEPCGICNSCTKYAQVMNYFKD